MSRIGRSYRVSKVLVEGSSTWSVDTRGDTVTGEEPLELRVNGRTLTTTMRTPGHDIELLHGFLYSEGHISSATQVTTARYCAGATGPVGANTYNVIEAEVAANLPLSAVRLSTTTSACGVCGSSSIDAVMAQTESRTSPVALDPRVVVSLPDRLREHQKQFSRTGGVHAAGAFTLKGEALVVREDIGRHNAADKVIGHLLMSNQHNQLPAQDLLLVMSSRASFELAQKAVTAGFGGLVAFSAASSLAIDLARQAGLALAGFVRDGRFNLYSGELIAH